MKKLSVEHIEQSIENALAGKSNLTQDILNIRGFSTPTIRHLFNNLCDIDGTYLEVGLFCGASFCSSFNQNCTSIGVEDHSQDFSAGFEQVKKELKENVDTFSERAKEVYVHYADCWLMDKSTLPKIDIYSYDGFHGELEQAKAITDFIDNMADTFVMIIDDANWSYVRSGTEIGLNTIKDKIEVKKRWFLGEGLQNHHVWHNGVLIYLINKK